MKFSKGLQNNTFNLFQSFFEIKFYYNNFWMEFVEIYHISILICLKKDGTEDKICSRLWLSFSSKWDFKIKYHFSVLIHNAGKKIVKVSIEFLFYFFSCHHLISFQYKFHAKQNCVKESTRIKFINNLLSNAQFLFKNTHDIPPNSATLNYLLVYNERAKCMKEKLYNKKNAFLVKKIANFVTVCLQNVFSIDSLQSHSSTVSLYLILFLIYFLRITIIEFFDLFGNIRN